MIDDSIIVKQQDNNNNKSGAATHPLYFTPDRNDANDDRKNYEDFIHDITTIVGADILFWSSSSFIGRVDY
jgi:hypothetical protein